VSDRDHRLTFLAPFDRPVVVPPRTRFRTSGVREAAARLAGLVARAPNARTLNAALAAQVEVHAYQLEPALAVAEGTRRLLIADDVGLGKTIQAALALAELRRGRPGFRAMVIVPRALRDQWRCELQERFGLLMTIGDREGLEDAVRMSSRGRNPWTGAGIWIVSIDFLKQPHVLDTIPSIPWDIVIVDEAHDACGDSVRHDAADEMARRARHVLLLTATPHAGDTTRFDRLQRLGQLRNIPDPLLVFRRSRTQLGIESGRHVRWTSVRPTPAESAVLDVVVAYERAVLEAASERQRDGALLLLTVFRKRALSTMTALRISIDRRLSWVSGRTDEVIDWIQPRLGFEDPLDARADDDCAGLTVESGLTPDVERTWLRRLRTLTTMAGRHESKVRRVVELLHRTREPVLVFTEFRHSLDALRSAIERALPGRRLAILTGSQSPAERAAALTTFQRGHVSVLLATDVASQGLNLQHRARWVVSLELPWSPSRIEQRIGRVDRIGQARTVHASLLVAAHPAEEGLLRSLARRTLIVKRVVGIDAFAGLVPPSEEAVARELLTGRPAQKDEAADARLALATSARWRRRSRAVAKHLRLKRSLAARWRAPAEGAGRPCHAVLRSAGSSPGGTIVVSVPITEPTGLLVERRLLCLRLRNVGPAEVNALLDSTDFHAWVTARLEKRLERLRRCLMATWTTRALVEEAIAGHLIGIGWPAELQGGLFDRREERLFTTARDEALAIERRVLVRRRNSDASSGLTIGTASVELVVSS
jgi:superfamily II DNA or RNA helicase